MTLPAQILWLLRHEWRLVLRASPNTRWLWWAGLGFMAIFTIAALVLRQTALRLPAIPDVLPAGVLLISSLVLLFIFSIMLSVAINSSVQMLFERGDMDLLLSSPLDTRLVLATRGIWLAITSLFAVALLVVPLTLAAVVVVGPRLLGMFFVLLALSLGAAGFGLLITLTLVRLLGARRARTVAQVVGVLFGASIYLLTQLSRLINPEQFPWLNSILTQVTQLKSSSFWFIPAQAIWLDPFGIMVVLGFGFLFFLISLQFTHSAFLRGATSSILGGKIKPPSKIAAFANNLGLNVFRKEWRLVLRDPMLISQTLLQIIYLIPMFLAFFGGSSRSNPSGFNLQTIGTYPLLVVAAILAGGSLAQNFTQIMVAAEDAAELIRMSPTAGGRIRNAKLMAAILPVWGVFIPLIIWRGVLEPKHFFILIGFAAVTILGGLMILWTAKPFVRSDFKQHARKQHWLIGLALLLLSIASAAALLLPLWLPIWWSLPAVMVGLFIPAMTYWFSKGNSSLGY
jgi:ABC-2 type transport system permease protein